MPLSKSLSSKTPAKTPEWTPTHVQIALGQMVHERLPYGTLSEKTMERAKILTTLEDYQELWRRVYKLAEHAVTEGKEAL